MNGKTSIELRIIEQKNVDAVLYSAVQLREAWEEHKYFLSEQKGYNIGFLQAWLDWTTGPQSARFREAYQNNLRTFRKICRRRCDNECRTFYLIDEDLIVPRDEINERRAKAICSLPMEIIHKVLHDGPYSRENYTKNS